MPVKCHTTVSLMDAKTYKGIVNMDFTVFPLMLREENLGKLQYDEMVGRCHKLQPLVWSTFRER